MISLRGTVAEQPVFLHSPCIHIYIIKIIKNWRTNTNVSNMHINENVHCGAESHSGSIENNIGLNTEPWGTSQVTDETVHSTNYSTYPFD